MPGTCWGIVTGEGKAGPGDQNEYCLGHSDANLSGATGLAAFAAGYHYPARVGRGAQRGNAYLRLVMATATYETS